MTSSESTIKSDCFHHNSIHTTKLSQKDSYRRNALTYIYDILNFGRLLLENELESTSADNPADWMEPYIFRHHGLHLHLLLCLGCVWSFYLIFLDRLNLGFMRDIPTLMISAFNPIVSKQVFVIIVKDKLKTKIQSQRLLIQAESLRNATTQNRLSNRSPVGHVPSCPKL